jgi:hypothetical protein
VLEPVQAQVLALAGVLEAAVGHLGDQGMWVLIQTQPKSRARAMRIARPWSRVQGLEARPHSTPLAQARGLLLVDPGHLVGVVEGAVRLVGVLGKAGGGAVGLLVERKSSWTPPPARTPGGGGAVLSGVEVAGAAIISAAASTSASSNTITEALPPSSR